ncbi:MAG: hypothetical protein K6U14_07420 [Firmicutes bacterium]|nr:hypothetical protein [Alicyclobacillaceae bacterium]MCL6497445.1 hypothetical protein [Bacillota bacterium]
MSLLLFLQGSIVVSNLEYSALLLGVFFLVVRSHYDSRLSTLLVVAGAIALTIAASVKASVIPAIAVIDLAWTIAEAEKRRVRTVLAFWSTVAAMWLLIFAIGGGGFRYAFIWPVAVLPLVIGYVAMALHGPVSFVIPAVIVMASAAMVTLIAAARHSWKQELFWVVIAIDALLFTVFKDGFVRQDNHVLVFYDFLPWLGFLYLMWIDQAKNAYLGKTRQAATAFMLMGSIVVVSAFQTVIPSSLRLGGIISGFMSAVHFVSNQAFAYSALAEQKQVVLDQTAGLKDLQPLLSGRPTFAWPWNSNAVIAAGGDLRMPPVLQEYSAYTSVLDIKDAEFFMSPARPDVGLLFPDAIDGRLPLQTAPLSFRSLLACYKAVALSGPYLLIESKHTRCDVPVPNPLGNWQRASFNQWFKVPVYPGKLTEMEVRIEPSFLGKALGFFFRRTPVYLEVKYTSGQTQMFRLVDATLSEGVTVSSIVANPASLANMFMGVPQNNVQQVALVTGRPWEWASRFLVRFGVVDAPQPSWSEVPIAPLAQTEKSPVTLLGGYIDSVSGGEIGASQKIVTITGWYNLGDQFELDPNVSLALQIGKRFLRVPHLNIPRPDVVKVFGPGTPSLTGFEAWVPEQDWNLSGKMYVLWKTSAGYVPLGALNSGKMKNNHTK